MKHGKIFVVPMSGNSSAYHKAYDPVLRAGKRHLMRLPEIEGLNKSSVERPYRKYTGRLVQENRGTA